jgi:carbon monoxide dehydrogenase subunit G
VIGFEASVEVDASAQRVWDALVDWERQGDWMPFTRVRVETGGPRQGLGARLSAVTGVGSAALVDPMTIDVWEPPRRVEVAHHGKVVTGRGVFLVERLGSQRTRFTWREELAGEGPRQLLDRAAAPVGRLMLGVAVRRFARRLERG